ncbi:unnamed protein product [Strongylus vulgaris]|uniref:Zinc finger C2H2 LYAR-type domain-containing protein n=1 Tax=Strongylus vulgaris TaxID=40348 RepID=A0A3P7LGJ7_STRVU|nr:unnamed protein product [Strongylus vulgaris]
MRIILFSFTFIAIFRPYAYQQHVKCIRENQKYGSKNYIEKEAKGEVKQNAWCEQVERAIEFVKEPKLKSLLKNIQGYSNIPRKVRFHGTLLFSLISVCVFHDKAVFEQVGMTKPV